MLHPVAHYGLKYIDVIKAVDSFNNSGLERTPINHHGVKGEIVLLNLILQTGRRTTSELPTTVVQFLETVSCDIFNEINSMRVNDELPKSPEPIDVLKLKELKKRGDTHEQVALALNTTIGKVSVVIARLQKSGELPIANNKNKGWSREGTPPLKYFTTKSFTVPMLEVLINEFNNEVSVKELALLFKCSMPTINTRIKELRKYGYVGHKNTKGKLITQPISAIPVEEQEFPLSYFVNEVFTEEDVEYLINMFNDEKHTYSVMAGRLGVTKGQLSSKIEHLQRKNVLKNKNNQGMIVDDLIHRPRTVKKPIVEEEESPLMGRMAELLNEEMSIGTGKLSIKALEQLIEIIHRSTT